jgi:hypothetical protein
MAALEPSARKAQWARYGEDVAQRPVERLALLRTSDCAECDTGNPAGDVESVGKRDRRDLDGRLCVL